MAEQENVASLFWNNYVSVPILTLISYEYLLLFEKEVEYVWKRQWSPMSCLYLVVRYLGLSIGLISGCYGGLFYMPKAPYATSYGLGVLIYWGMSVYFCFTEAILIWRLYALYSRSKRLLYVLLGLFLPIVALSIGSTIYLYSRSSAYSVEEIVTPNARYCTVSFNAGPMPAIYTSIPTTCYDIFLVVLAVAILMKHLKERKEVKMRPNAYVIAIVRHHIIYFVLNLTNQILQVLLWAKVPLPVSSLSELFIDTAPYILAPRFIISIWDMHAHEQCANVSTMFEDCACWASPSTSEEYEMDFENTV